MAIIIMFHNAFVTSKQQDSQRTHTEGCSCVMNNHCDAQKVTNVNVVQ